MEKTPKPEQDILMPEEAARELRVSRATLERLRREEGLPCFLLMDSGKKRLYRYSRQEIVEWMKGRRERQVTRTLQGERFTQRER
jgi:helix-turn-helix protein